MNLKGNCARRDEMEASIRAWGSAYFGVPYDEGLADRVRRVLGPRADISEKKMFGGLAFLRDGKMFCGILNDELMVRVGPEAYEESLRKPHVRPMDFTGRPMKGYVFVAASGCRSQPALKKWVDLGDAFVATLPDKPVKATAKANSTKKGTAVRKRVSKQPHRRALSTDSDDVEPAPTAKPNAKPSRKKSASKRLAQMSDAMDYALLLRGVNVGTKNSLPMSELRSLLERIGCTNVRTYIQSGNAVFGTTCDRHELTAAIEVELEAYLGRPVVTTLRTADELRAIERANPFADRLATPKFVCVTFLSQAPKKSEFAPISEGDWAPDEWKLIGREIYSWYPNGQGRSALAEALAKLRLQGTLTTRNWNTVSKLVNMLEAG